MKLHYSQTQQFEKDVLNRVSVPYEITLLSNQRMFYVTFLKVSVPYEITLLSNLLSVSKLMLYVSVPYEITLLSNAM